MNNTLRYALLGTLAATQLAACNSGGSVSPVLASVPVNVQIDLQSQQYQALQFNNGVVAIPPGSANGQGGLKGIYVVRQNASTYLAFERNCPYKPNDACALVMLDRSRLFFRDTCCGSQFNLQGQVTGGPSPYPLRQYSTSVSNGLLSIIN